MFSSHKRQTILKDLKDKPLDILVIGGGITGAGIALDAVTRGMRIGLVDMQDFAAGTSSRSTKLVHGGLRYLKQGELKLVSDVGKEREIVYENGPHVTTPQWMMLPFYEGGTFGKITSNIGLLAYDFLAGVKKDERRQILSTREAIMKEPLLKKEGLKGAGYYVEYKTDDARLTIEVIKKAVEYGTLALNYAKCTQLFYNQTNTIYGVMIEDQMTGKTYSIEAKKIINATGPWVDDLRTLDGSKKGKTLYLAKGSHLIFSQEDFPLQQAIYFDAPDGRMIFAIPRDGHTYVGTTDTTFEGDLKHPTVTKDEVEYLLKAIHHMFPTLSLTATDIQSSYAGVRPLISQGGKKADEISRKDEVFISKSGLISIAGGKLTGYRKMAEEVVDLVKKQFKKEAGILFGSSQTSNLPISGGKIGGADKFRNFKQDMLKRNVSYEIDEDELIKLIQRYGTNVEVILKLYKECQQEAIAEQIDPIVLAELKYAIDYELAYKPDDFFIRRTGTMFFDMEWTRAHKENVISYMKKTLDWSAKQSQQYSEELTTLINASTLWT